jgi:multifunctional 2-oxoglutarate metabolism enzyme
MYEKYIVDKNSVDQSWWPILERYQPMNTAEATAGIAAPGEPAQAAPTASAPASAAQAPAPAPVPSSVNRSLPPELDPIVGKALAKEVGDRYASAATMAAELRSVGAILDVRNDAQQVATPFVPVPQHRSSGGRWLIILLVLAALAAAAYGLFTRV